MKNNSNFKSLFRTSLVALCLLTVGVGNAWGSNTYTFYCVPKALWGDDWDSDDRIKIYWYHKGETSGVDEGSNTGKFYDGNLIYSFSITVPYDGVHYFQFQRFNSGNTYEDNYDIDVNDNVWYSQSNFAGKLFKGDWSESTPLWKTYGRDITFYAVPESLDGSLWNEGSHSLYADIKYGDSDWKKVQMTKTDYNYNGTPIYTCTTLIPYNVVKQIKFYYNDGSDHDLYNCNPASQYGTDDIDGKILLGWNGSSHNWVSYGRDVTIYTIPDYLFKGYGTKYNESNHYPAVCIQMGDGNTWPTVNMTKTSYTYDTYPIYKATILIDKNKFWEFQIKYFKKSDDTQVGLYQFNNNEPKTEYAPSYIDDKLYHGWNGSSHDFFAYTYDVALDQQSGSSGTTTIKATVGSPMPAITLPGRDGYAFGGYWTETGGGGTQYYNADGSSAANWNSRTLTTLYAQWTAREYTITLEDMEPTTAGQGSVTLTFDASTNMTSAVTKPTKNNYTFDGYWTDNDDEGATLVTQLIDENGNWIKDVSPYTGHDGSGNPTWIYPNIKSLFAKWTETAYTITPSVSPAGAGSVNTVTDAHIITASSTITATPANAAWIFDYWECGDQVGIASGSGTNAVTVTAGKNSTITAHFKPRYELVGDIWDGSGNGGMPGWSYDGTGVFTFNSFTALGTGDGKGCDLSCSRTLNANTTYRFQIHDRVTGNHGYATAATYIGDGDHLLFNTKDQNVMLAATGAGTYTFRITNITEDDGKYYPTVSVERPHEVNFGQKYLDIDGTLHTGTTGGTADATAGSALSSGDYVTYNTSVSHTATPASGYTFAGWWSSDAFEGNAFSNTNPMTYAVTSGDNTYAKFVETSTAVTLANDGNGKVQIGGADATSTTCGVTTTRTLTAVPNPGYKFNSWTTSSSPDFEVSSSSSATTTLTGHGAGTAGTLTANFTGRYSIKGTMNSENWGTTHTLSNIGTNASSKDTCFVTMTLPANTTYEFAIYDEHTEGWYKANKVAVYNMTYTNHTNWEFADDNTYNCGITTAGKGTYKFIFNITDKTVTVVYPTSYQVNYGASVGGSVTSVVDGDSNTVPNGGYVVAGGSVTYTAAAASGYTFVGWCNNDSYGDPFNNDDSWTHSPVAATSNSYAKFKSTNFVIYRSGDKAGDPRATYDDVESYGGGTISEAIEYRMKVHELNNWYSLCLPFTVNAVKVWDEGDGEYYDLVPYYRTEVGAKLQGGHYIIRTPKQTSDLLISEFGDWRDPTYATGWLPSKNTPYIIQWHMGYFLDKYISFFSATGESIPTSFSAGSAPTSDNVVNVCYNNSMTSGSVTGAYVLVSDYGDGAWLRGDKPTDNMTIPPFECYIRASSTATGKYLVIRRDMTIEDTPTDVPSVTGKPASGTSKVLLNGQLYIIRGDRMYTIQGTLVEGGK